jgi:tRNA-2-methylthio-N6-dimethylallyladenosine synthase
MYSNIDYDKIDLTMPPPEAEPYRQYWFIAKCREEVKKLSEDLGRSLNYFTHTFGCQMNARDSEKLSGILEEIGYVEADSEEADFVIYNTCTVRENANLKIYGRLGYLNTYKKKNPHMRIALCGCMMQEEQVIEKLKKSYRHVNLIFGTHNIFKFPEYIHEILQSEKQTVHVWDETDLVVEKLPSKRKYSFKSGVNIMFGCNNFCSYCIVPYVRGRERSCLPEEILSEIRTLAKDGVKEIMLLGQNVNSYGNTFDEPYSFAKLLEQIAQIDGIERIRFMTSHPKDLSDELIDVMAKYEKICRHLHLPLQSGSTRILKEMNRKYTKEQYLALVDRIRAKMPDISLTTDIIVGFPGETEEDFNETMDVVEKVGYDSAFTFIYSKRSGTKAAKMENQVPEDVVKARFNRLLTLVQEKGANASARLTGTVGKVLVENINEQDDSLVTGRLGNNSVVHFPGDASLIGQIVDVSLDECRGFYYIGTMLSGQEA